MRLSVRCFAISIAACGIVWVGLMLMYTWSDIWDSRGSRHEKESDIAARVQILEKTITDELKESTELLKLLRERFKTQIEEKAKKKTPLIPKDHGEHVLPVLVMACNRVTVKRCLDKLVNYRPSVTTFPIIVSQDCEHKPTYNIIQEYIRPGNGVSYIKQPNQSEIVLPVKQKKFQGYYRIARHYKFALTHVLDELGHDSVIIVEDDLDISVDFFEYFLGTYPLLKQDPSLWCISAWNDNGKRGLIDLSRPDMLHRTQFFPGLGWLLPAKHWRRLKPKWPAAFFDDWLREPEQIGGLSCIRPEISRTSTFGKEGVSKGLFFDLHLRFIQLNDKFVPFTTLDLTYLLKDSYESTLRRVTSAAAPTTADELRRDAAPPGNVRVVYAGKDQFKKILKTLGLMDDFRSGVARTVYNGVVSCFYKNRRVYIVPETPFVGYDRTWS